MGCKGSKVRILSPRPLTRQSNQAFKLSCRWAFLLPEIRVCEFSSSHHAVFRLRMVGAANCRVSVSSSQSAISIKWPIARAEPCVVTLLDVCPAQRILKLCADSAPAMPERMHRFVRSTFGKTRVPLAAASFLQASCRAACPVRQLQFKPLPGGARRVAESVSIPVACARHRDALKFPLRRSRAPSSFAAADTQSDHFVGQQDPGGSLGGRSSGRSPAEGLDGAGRGLNAFDRTSSGVSPRAMVSCMSRKPA